MSAPSSSVETDGYSDFLVGRVANLTDDYAAASDRYTSALARSPHNQDLVDGAITAALASGNFERARAAARYAHGVEAPPYAHLVRGVDALLTEHWTQADGELAVVTAGAAQGLAARMLRVWARAGQHRVDPIDADLRPLIAIRPYGGLLNYQQALALDCVGRSDEALRKYTEAAGLSIWLPPAIERNADLLARQGAREQALQLLDLPANQADPELVSAAARLRAGQNAAAQPLSPARGAGAVLYGLGAIYLQESDTTNGLAMFSLALMLDPTSDVTRLAFAQAQSNLHHGDLARIMLAQIGPQSPYSSDARNVEARLLVDEGREDDAIALANSAAARGDLNAKRTLADIYRAGHHDAEAEGLYSELITATPNDWRLFFARGAARERLGRTREGEVDLQRALQLSPEQPDVLNYLGYTWIDQGNHLSDGLAMIQRALALRPESAAIVDSLGWAYFRMRDYPRAVDTLEHAVELDGGDPMLNEHLGDAYWRSNRRVEARYQWQRALGQSPDDPPSLQNKLDHGLPPEAVARVAHR